MGVSWTTFECHDKLCVVMLYIYAPDKNGAVPLAAPALEPSE